MLLFSPQMVHHSSTRGVTLVEMLVAFAIMSVTFVIVLDAFISSNRAAQVAQRRAEVADALSYALADIAREAQISGEFEFVGGQLKFQRIDTMSDVPAETIRYYQDSGRLYKKIGAQSAIALTPDAIAIQQWSADIDSISTSNKSVVRLYIKAYHVNAENDEEPDVVLHTTFFER